MLLLTITAGCYNSGGSDDPEPVALCSADVADSYRCDGALLQQCTGTVWETAEDCAAGGKSCEDSDGGMAHCVADQSCSTGETDGKCNPGSSCVQNADCASAVCGDNGICLPATCGNGMEDGEETGPDCGGECPACVGQPCSRDNHCVSNFCQGGACAVPSCTDQQQNGTETGVDCGGDCTACAVGKGCNVDGDCTSSRCREGTCAAPPATCDDGDKNGAETDVDCGGESCGGCPLEDNCMADSDCLSGYCKFGVCKEATCSDGEQNQGEAAVDCGGPCDPCETGKSCNAGGDCRSGRCEGGECSSCSDGRQSGGETGIDCGGPCQQGCSQGGSCSGDEDCATGKCEGGSCCQPNRCGDCAPLPEETCNGKDDDCDGQTDEGLAAEAPDCQKQQGVCQGAEAVCRGSQGWTCDEQVLSNHHPDYNAARDLNCDNIDNDCDGEVDEDPCKDDGDACTAESCSGGSCISQPMQTWSPCGTDRGSARENLKYCDPSGQCVGMDGTCICDSGNCFRYYRTRNGIPMSLVYSDPNLCSCASDGSAITFGSKEDTCKSGTTCQAVTRRGEDHYICPD